MRRIFRAHFQTVVCDNNLSALESHPPVDGIPRACILQLIPLVDDILQPIPTRIIQQIPPRPGPQVIERGLRIRQIAEIRSRLIFLSLH